MRLRVSEGDPLVLSDTSARLLPSRPSDEVARVTGIRCTRRMRGQTQAHRFLCADGHQYVVKFSNNPLGKRVLVNEWIATKLFHTFGLRAAQAAVVDLSQAAVAACTIEGPLQSLAAVSGSCFGSRYPVNPETTALYDALPDHLLGTVDPRDFLGALVLDQWLGNADSRQAVFHRDAATGLYTATLIDNSHIFGGPSWSFCSAPGQGRYIRDLVYRGAHYPESVGGWIERAARFPPDDLRRVFASVPPEWIDETDQPEFETLFKTLVSRRRLVDRCVRAVFSKAVN